MKLTMSAQEVASCVGLSVATLYQYAAKYPERIPPKLNTPGRRLLWAAEDVQAWIQAHKTKAICPASSESEQGERAVPSSQVL